MAEEPNLAEGDTNEWVGYLQGWLERLGFYDGEIDNWFGPKTSAAVSAAQSRYEIDDGGQVAQQTWKLIELASGENAELQNVWGDAETGTVEVPDQHDGDQRAGTS